MENNQRNTELTCEDELHREIANFNSSAGDLKGYECRLCKNRGYIAVDAGGQFAVSPCRCLEVRRCLQLMEASGINKEYTLENFKTEAAWQKQFLDTAKRFFENASGSWFFAGGQVGCGKTHICTGIVRELLKQGRPARYMLWREEIMQIKAKVKDAEEYAKMVEPLKTVDVLYIDDFFKTSFSGKPTAADVNLAFEVLNARYNRKDLITLISSEYILDELIDIDEAVASRIAERAAGYLLNFKTDRLKNYRLKNLR